MTTRALTFKAPPSQAIARDATTPNPGVTGAEVYSSATGSVLTWDGSKWVDRAELLLRIDSLSSAAYTLADTDIGREKSFTVTATVTVPANATVALPVGFQCLITRYGAGAVTISCAGGVTVNGLASLGVRAQYKSVSLRKVATDAWIASGETDEEIAGGSATPPGGSTTQIQFNSAGAFGGSANLTWTDANQELAILGASPEILIAGSAAVPGIPAAGRAALYAMARSGLIDLCIGNNTGRNLPMQRQLARRGHANVKPASGAVLTSCVSAAGTAFTNTGTVANPVPASTSLATALRRCTFSSGATAGTISQHRQNVLMCTRGASAGVGGFHLVYVIGLDTLQAGMRAFAGVTDTIAATTNVDPTTSTTPGKMGIAINANTGNWKFVTTATGVAPTVTDLGASFVVATGSLIELELWCPPNAAFVNYTVTNLITGANVTGQVTANFPASTAFLAPTHWVTNNATAAAAIMAFYRWTLESDYGV